MTALDALKEFIQTLGIPVLVPMLGLLLAFIGTVVPVRERWLAKKELVCEIKQSLLQGHGRNVTIRVTNTGRVQLIPDDHSRLLFIFGKNAVIQRVTPDSHIRASDLVIDKKQVVITPPFLNPGDAFSFHIYLLGHSMFKAISRIEGIPHIWWVRPVSWKRRLWNQDLLLVFYDVLLVGFLVAVPGLLDNPAIAPFARILKTPLYPLLLLFCLFLLMVGLWLYFSRLMRKTGKFPRLVVRQHTLRS